MNEMDPSLGILSSMITPAVLILASGSLVLTTSQRLGRLIERVRKISQEFMQVEQSQAGEEAVYKQRKILYTLLSKSVRRSRLLTRAMILFYISLGLFVATSLAIGIVAVTHLRYTWIPTLLGMAGALVLFSGSAILIVESRITYSAIADEMDYIIESNRPKVPEQPVRTRGLRNWLRVWR